MKARVAVAGAGIYGSTIAASLAEKGHAVDLFDPLGILRAASAINQYRIHSGYHYPRSPETISETLESRAEFMAAFAPAIVQNTHHYYAIPREGSVTSPELFETVMAQYGLFCRPCQPDWMNFGFIAKCYEVEEQIYDPLILRDLAASRIQRAGVQFKQCEFAPGMRDRYDSVVWATYGLGFSKGVFSAASYQIAEKILIELPPALRSVSLVVVDGPFTAFDPYGSSSLSLFGSAKHTNHWISTDPAEPIPEPYVSWLNRDEFQPVPFSRFDRMRKDACLSVPTTMEARYFGSRFTIRVVENNPAQDRRTLYVRETAPGELHVFSGKVVGAVKAARIICEKIAKNG